MMAVGIRGAITNYIVAMPSWLTVFPYRRARAISIAWLLEDRLRQQC